MTRNAPTASSSSSTRNRVAVLVVLVLAAIAAGLLEPVIGSLASRVVSWACLGAAAAGGLVALVQHRKARQG